MWSQALMVNDYDVMQLSTGTENFKSSGWLVRRAVGIKQSNGDQYNYCHS